MLTRIALNALCVLLGFALAALGLAGLEGLLRVADIGAAVPHVDPLAGFSSHTRFFEPTERPDGTRIYRVIERYRRQEAAGRPSYREFLAEKPRGTFRIFVTGESSAAGVPYGADLSFAGWLARRLEAALPSVQTEVVNAAFPGFGTRRLLLIAREIAAYDPDLLIIFCGHNEWAEARFYRHLLAMDPRLFRLWERVADMRLYRLLFRLRGARPGHDARADLDLDAEVNHSLQMFGVLMDRAGGTGYATSRELAYRDITYRHNLEGMIAAMRAVDARVMLLTLSQNFADWPPGASATQPGLSPADGAAWQQHVDDGDRLAFRVGDCGAALEAYARALEIDAQSADLHYRIATCRRKLGDLDAARAHYRWASDLDLAQHGAPTHFNEILRTLARAHDLLFVDIDAVLTRESEAGLVGDDLFVDFLHPNIRAHQLIAAAVAEALHRAGIPAPADQWLSGRYADPDPGSIYDAEPQLRVNEQMMKAFACALARREACVRERAEAVVALDPHNPYGRKLLDRIARGNVPWRRSARQSGLPFPTDVVPMLRR